MKAWQKAQLCAWKFSPDLWQKTYVTRHLHAYFSFINLLPDHEVGGIVYFPYSIM